jgi:hypothetical protein
MPPLSTDYEWMRNKMDEISTGIAELNTQMAATIRGCVSCNDSIRELKSTVFGNGSPGLKTRLERLENARDAAFGWLGKVVVGVGWLATTACLVYSTFVK